MSDYDETWQARPAAPEHPRETPLPQAPESLAREALAPEPTAPELEWLQDGVPRAAAFGDTYFSRAGGLAETRHVFLAGNGLPERWADRESFTIAEFGFGTGLSFLTTLAALHQVAETDQGCTVPRLTFLSFELYPMTREQLARALAAFPELEQTAAQLLEKWAPGPGWNELEIGGHQLILGIGDAREMILDLERSVQEVQPVDAWFLDGFSPSKNPELWQPELLASAFAITASGGTLATYTAAGWVRRNLQAAGFTIEKRKGFAGKREMVVGWKGE